MTDADLAELRRLPRGDAGRGARRRRPRRGRGRRPVPRPDRRARRQRRRSRRSGARSSRSRGPTSRSSCPAPTRTWSADLHAPILAALERRDAEAVVAALERHFDEVSDNMARRWPDDERAGSDRAPASRGDRDERHPPAVRGAVGRVRRGCASTSTGPSPIEHVLDDMNFLELPPRRRPDLAGGHPRRARHRLAPGRGQGHRLRRPPDDVQRPLAGRADPEGRRHDARAPDGGGRPASVPRLGRPLPRPDGPVPRRRVEPRQVDGPDRGLPARRDARLDRDDGHRRGGPRGRRARRSRSSRSAPRAPSAPTRPRRTAASRSSSARCRAGRSTRSRATSTSSSCPRSTATSTRRASR